ncbi:MAG: transposase, partial [Candidatus Heimdallarchaeota archaeon]|nr:transposase [Candidatus Heimdallarchaeota archaeon]
CGFEIKIVDRSSTVVYNCLECGYRIPTDTKICRKHGDAGYKEIILPASKMIYKCKKCGSKEQKSRNLLNEENLDHLFRKVTFSRSIQQLVRELADDRILMRKFLNSLNSNNSVAALKDFMFPDDILGNIADLTGCDKAVEKSHLKYLILWFFSLFTNGNYEQLAVNAVAQNSARIISRTLTDDRVISANALGVRLENERVVDALEKVLEFDSMRKQSEIFTDSDGLKPVFYDWMYLTKSGDVWEFCQKIPSSDTFHGFKIGFGVDWNTKAIVALNIHGAEHPNDALAFRRDLSLKNVKGLVHITDRGAFDSQTLQKIDECDEYFIIRLKKNLKYRFIFEQQVSNEKYSLAITSRPKIRLLSSGMIKLDANPELGGLKYVKFQYNNPNTGKFETLELISNLKMDSIDIIELSAQRWRATETEYNILQHGFGLEKIFVRKPEKVWSLVLIAVICKSLFERILTAIHAAHGGILDLATFKRDLGILIEHIARGGGNTLPLSQCNSITCPYRRERGRRLL